MILKQGIICEGEKHRMETRTSASPVYEHVYIVKNQNHEFHPKHMTGVFHD